jgi:hypothetical protein
MLTWEQLICQEGNPFDYLTTGDFFRDQEDRWPSVQTIHAPVIQEVEQVFNQTAQDRKTRTLLLVGEKGAGKSYLLKRIKQQLNARASFAYIGPWPSAASFRRHTLQHVVDSLQEKPEGGEQSQLQLWLQQMFNTWRNQRSGAWGHIMDVLRGRQEFIGFMRQRLPTIHQAQFFFSVLYDMQEQEKESDRYQAGVDWLRGESLTVEQDKSLGHPPPNQSENSANRMLHNLGYAANLDRPLVLCFDQLDSAPKYPDGSLDLQVLFDVNTALHNASVPNFVVIISIIEDSWRSIIKNNRIVPADLARIDRQVELMPIDLEQARALWAYRVAPLHRQVNQRPEPGNILFPLQENWLEEAFPVGETTPRDALAIARKRFEDYRRQVAPQSGKVDDKERRNAAFNLRWRHALQEIEKRKQSLSHWRSPQLMQYLVEALRSLQVVLLNGSVFEKKSSYVDHGILCQLPDKPEMVTGLVWVEEAHLGTYGAVLRQCLKAVNAGRCARIVLVRFNSVGTPIQKARQAHEKFVAADTPHRHFCPDTEAHMLASVYPLAAHFDLVNRSNNGELMLGSEQVSRDDLSVLVREQGILNNCQILQWLKVDGGLEVDGGKPPGHDLRDVVIQHVVLTGMLGYHTLIKAVTHNFPQEPAARIQQTVDDLCHEGTAIRLLDSMASEESRIIVKAS